MDRALVVVFDREDKAYQGKNALWKLDAEGSLTIFTSAVLEKKADGTTEVIAQQDQGPLGAVLGTIWGTLVGLLGGVPGMVAGASVGFIAGGTADVRDIRFGDDFVADVKELLLPNRWALVAEIDEDWTTPLDTQMEAIGGTVFRRAVSDQKRRIHDEHIAAMKADLAQMKAEHAKANVDRKVKLQEKIDQLATKIQAQLEKAKERDEASVREAKAKAEVLKAKATAAKAKVKAS